MSTISNRKHLHPQNTSPNSALYTNPLTVLVPVLTFLPVLINALVSLLAILLITTRDRTVTYWWGCRRRRRRPSRDTQATASLRESAVRIGRYISALCTSDDTWCCVRVRGRGASVSA